MVKINDFNSEAKYYDLLEKNNQPFFLAIVDFLAEVFKKNKVDKILDITCGTGAQAIPFGQKGFTVVGIDIACELLKIARRKSKGSPNVSFVKGDARDSKVGQFGAVISMMNSLGYLSKDDFRKALLNINKNLTAGGLFVFDNTNKDCLEAGNFITDKTINTAGEENGIRFVRFTTSKYDKKTGIIVTKWEAAVQKGYSKPVNQAGIWKRQTYTQKEVEEIFSQTGFKLEQICDRNLGKFKTKKSFSYLIIAKKTNDHER